MLRACRWELKACRKDLTCRAAVQCAVDCGLGGDAGSRGCAFQCALDNQNDATQKMFGCVLENECLPAP
jgi:propanediol dehydratase large subunit